MKNDFCIIKVYAATNNEYVVKEGLTFDEAQEELEKFNQSRNSMDEPCMYIIGDGVGNLNDESSISVKSDWDFEEEDFVTEEELYIYTSINPVNV